MLIRVRHPNGVVTYQSPLLGATGVPHAFSTRHGGVSPAPFDTLNLGNPLAGASPDPNEHLNANYRRLQAALDDSFGTPPHPVYRAWVTQVHGRRVERLDPEPDTEYAETLAAGIRDRFHGQIEADAMLTGCPQVLLTIRAADCFPVLLASDDGRQVAAVHCGWRSTVNGILERIVRAFAEESIVPARLVAAIGPGISAAAFEVGPEVVAAFEDANLAAAIVEGAANHKSHIDLQHAIHTQLSRLGLARIESNTLCTFRDREDFYSHRRDAGHTGRMAAVIRPASGPPK
jgi:YfiH family protein